MKSSAVDTLHLKCCRTTQVDMVPGPALGRKVRKPLFKGNFVEVSPPRAACRRGVTLLTVRGQMEVAQPRGGLPFPQACTRPYHSPQLLHSKVKALSRWPVTWPGAHTYSSSSPISKPVRPCRMVCGKEGGSPQGFSEEKESQLAYAELLQPGGWGGNKRKKQLSPSVGAACTLNWDHKGCFPFTLASPGPGRMPVTNEAHEKYLLNE